MVTIQPHDIWDETYYGGYRGIPDQLTLTLISQGVISCVVRDDLGVCDGEINMPDSGAQDKEIEI